MTAHGFSRQGGIRGFTLLELVLSLIIASVLGTFIYTVFSSRLLRPDLPTERIQSTLALQNAMERMSAAHEAFLVWQPETDYPLGAYVFPTCRTGKMYECTTAGTTGTNEPAWAAVTVDGGVEWQERAGIPKIEALRINIENRIYGSYSADTTYIDFDPAPPPAGSDTWIEKNIGPFSAVVGIPMLKVTLRSDTGETLVTVFVP